MSPEHEAVKRLLDAVYDPDDPTLRTGTYEQLLDAMFKQAQRIPLGRQP